MLSALAMSADVVADTIARAVEFGVTITNGARRR
jgi:hypothetical protein